MSQLKWTYWIPGIGVAFIMQNQGAYFNSRKERNLVVYHVLTGILAAAGILLLAASF